MGESKTGGNKTNWEVVVVVHLEKNGALIKAVTVGIKTGANLNESMKVETLTVGDYLHVGIKAKQKLRKTS